MMKNEQGVISRGDDVSAMIGNIGWNGVSVVKITGVCSQTGLPMINGRIDAWVGFDSLRNGIPFTDITGMGPRSAKRTILKDYPTSFRLTGRQLGRLISIAANESSRGKQRATPHPNP